MTDSKTRSRQCVKPLIITGFGLNCEAETAAAFRLCGCQPTLIHLNDLIAQPELLEHHHILVFIGGFSFGDHLGAGTVFASRIRHHLIEKLRSFVDDGKLILGICNGFQTITRLGLVPAVDGAYFQVDAALTHNDSNCFRDDWVLLKANPNSPCVFTRGIECIPLPIRHGEGKFTVRDQTTLEKLRAAHQDALYYADPVTHEPTMEFPYNPNGSVEAIAGVCDPTGRIFGLMPHPEAYLSPYNHCNWRNQFINGVLPEKGLGVIIFENAVEFAAGHLL
ncbi:MAG: phosphoribosylformylglycinamidine synthase subunit PurQ [Lentisphaerae bacterium]|nr:MAG: phosphoribosylformylglycinamidine synthase subunit PurQ [Lentisphaerota bacterium]